MNREEILEIFPDAGEDQLIALAQIFDRGAGEMYTLRKENADMKAQLEAVAAEKHAEEQQAVRQKLTERFEDAVGEREFVHEFVRQSVLADFIDLAMDEANAHRSDCELLDELTQDKGCFVRRYQVTMGDIKPVEAQDVSKLSDAEYYEAFRMKGVQ